ncbi:hypothetical protein TorRG33x02_006020, partial [Trema orientale]
EHHCPCYYNQDILKRRNYKLARNEYLTCFKSL